MEIGCAEADVARFTTGLRADDGPQRGISEVRIRLRRTAFAPEPALAAKVYQSTSCTWIMNYRAL